MRHRRGPSANKGRMGPMEGTLHVPFIWFDGEDHRYRVYARAGEGAHNILSEGFITYAEATRELARLRCRMIELLQKEGLAA